MDKLSRAGYAVIAAGVVALELIALASWQGWIPRRVRSPVDLPLPMLQTPIAQAPAAVQLAPAATALPAAAAPPQPRPEDSYYAQLRGKVRWVSAQFGGDAMATPDYQSRMLLAKSAAERAGLDEVGLGYQDVYGVINAETSWVPRTGMGKNGTASHGVAQFEPATARALGLRDPNDLVEAVHVAAEHMREAALWSEARIARLKLGTGERAARLREGVSIYYNLSSRGRSAWNGKNTSRLPVETRRHIMNTRLGAAQAISLEVQLQAMQRGRGNGGTATASAQQQGR
ncbi:hypothetical protein [uncultured Ramlibacter sp.]|uniref:hypothetical protein n=1 Tax=uncultured Ramlibacter sp. TaxID=260755 RepID=UPI002630C027|nr:hypothetical protein [uncultured Ramlibacter sp.]